MSDAPTYTPYTRQLESHEERLARDVERTFLSLGVGSRVNLGRSSEDLPEPILTGTIVDILKDNTAPVRWDDGERSPARFYMLKPSRR